MTTYKACRLTYQGKRFAIATDGSVTELFNPPVDGLAGAEVTDHEQAKAVRAEAARLRRNRNARERNQAMRDLGLVKTPYGWE